MVEETRSYIILATTDLLPTDLLQIETKVNEIASKGYYLKFWDIDGDGNVAIAIMSQREPDKYQGITTIDEVTNMVDANALLSHGWVILDTYANKIRMGLRE